MGGGGEEGEGGREGGGGGKGNICILFFILHVRTINETSPGIKMTGLDVMQGHPLRKTCFGPMLRLISSAGVTERCGLLCVKSSSDENSTEHVVDLYAITCASPLLSLL